MIQEYLLQNLDEKDAIKAYKPDGINQRLFKVDNGKCWYVQFSTKGESEENAQKLSFVDDYVRKTFHVIVLNDDCSAYLNKRLYPLISRFEFSLRKLLYITSSISPDEESAANIKNLDTMAFGDLFNLLFIDTSFMEKVKKAVKIRNQEIFTKEDVIAAIETIEEVPLWDKLLEKDSVPTLRRRFNDVRIYRNDVMHSHHISWATYLEIKDLYTSINRELKQEIKAINITEKRPVQKPTSTPTKKPLFNQTLSEALRMRDEITNLTDAVNRKLTAIDRLSDLVAISNAIPDIVQGSSALLETQPIVEQAYKMNKLF